MQPRVVLLSVLLFTTLPSAPAAWSGPVIDVTLAASTGKSSVAECAVACDPVKGIVYIAAHSDRQPDDFAIDLFSSRHGGPWELTALTRSYDGLGIRGDPSVAVDDLGTVYVAYTTVAQGKPFAIVCARSTDSGVTFEPPVYVIKEPATAAGDKPYLTLGRDRNGELLVMVTFTRLDAPPSPGIWLAISRDRGRTFETPALVQASPPGTSYGMAATGSEGEIYVSYLAPNAVLEQEVRISRSDDGGTTFDLPIRLAVTGMGFRHTIPAAPHRGIGAVPSLVIDTSPAHPGRVYVVYVSADRVDRADTEVLCRWADPASGLSALQWSEPIPVHRQDRGSNFHPWLSVDPESGVVGVISHGTRSDVSRRKVETWLSLSSDGGNTWAERKISESTADVTGQFGFSPFNYLEYIGLSLAEGKAHCAWAGAGGTDPNKLHYLYREVSILEVLAGRTLEVPGSYPTPASALAAANAGDRVVLDQAIEPFPGSFDMVWHVSVESAPGDPATIDAGGLPEAVRISDGFSGALRNVRITGFQEVGVRLEAGPIQPLPGVTEPPSPASIRRPVEMTGVTFDGGLTAVRTDGIPVRLERCFFQGQARAVELELHDPAEAAATRLSRCLFRGAPDSPASVALLIRGGPSEAAPRIERNTLHGFGTGIRLVDSGTIAAGAAFRPLLAGNLITDFSVSPVEIVPAGTGSIEPVLTCNNFWPPLREQGVASHSFAPSGDEPGGNRSVDPRYCGPGNSDLEFSLRIDSPVSAGNSPCGPVGALDVACAPPVLETASRLAAGTVLELTSLTIPPGGLLTIEPGCGIARRPADGKGDDSGLALFETAGRLVLQGSAAAPIVLDPGPAGTAIVVRSQPEARLDASQVEFRGGRTGIRLDGGSGRISECLFTEPESTAVMAGSEVDSLRILDSIIAGRGGIGLDLTDSNAGTVVAGTRLTGWTEGIRLAGGRALVGLAPEEGGGNIFEANEVAVRLLPSGRMENTCPPGPRLVNNEFRENRHALVIEPGAPVPDLGLAMPGNNLFWNQSDVSVVVGNADCGPVPARGNRFGPGDFMTADDPPGSVDWSGWLVDCPLDESLSKRPFCRVLAIPNPSAGAVHLQFDLDRQAARMTVDIFDLQGRVRRRLYDETPAAPRFSIDWDGRDDRGQPIVAGVYWVVGGDELGNRVSLRIVRFR